ncbi:MAG TPA: ATP synthase F1 subunit delta [Verrucomicrobiae bacterium]|nr:ATP synthase F1 subunit delta [Verrucomicrobiae bacterium]
MVASRYATALADVALERKNAPEVKRDLAAFVQAFADAPDLRHFLDNPAVGRDEKHAVIRKIAAKMQLVEPVLNFILLVVDHERAELLREMQDAFVKVLNDRLGIAEAEIVSARELTPAERKELTGVLERRTGLKIEARFSEDKSLLGGAVVRLGSTIYDGSVREQLARMRARLEGE